MNAVNRRVVLPLGLAAATGLVFGASAEEGSPAEAPSTAEPPYAPDFGTEIAPGVRQVDFGAAFSTLSGYKAVSMRDLVFQPGTNTFDPMTKNDMISHVTHGLIRFSIGDGERMSKRQMPPWITPMGTKAAYRNTGADVAVLRIIDLVSA
jgi:hypothetical protein